MTGKRCMLSILLATSAAAQSAEPGTAPVPPSVAALTGCWEGQGEVRGKPVAIAISAYPIVQDAMIAVEAASVALADPEDRYAAHLVFGGAGKPSGAIVGYWADSFGGAFAASGRGASRVGGFDVTYQYPDDAFVNRWRLAGDRLTWKIVARTAKGVEKPFAGYVLEKVACRSSAPR